MRDLRKFARQTNAQLIAGGLALVFIVGLGLVYVFIGPQGALTGLICLLAAMVPVALTVLVLWIIDAFVRRANEDR